MFPETEMKLARYQSYSDMTETVPISVKFKITVLEPDSMGYYRHTAHGRLLNEIIGTNVFDILPTHSTKEYFATITQNNHTDWNSGLPLNFSINKGNKFTEFPLSFDYLIRGYDPELSQHFRNNNAIIDDTNKQLMPAMTSDMTSGLVPFAGLQLSEISADWHFKAMISMEELAMSNYACFYNLCLCQNLILSYEEFITIPKARQEEFLIQIKKKEQYLQTFGKYYADKLNNLFSAAIKENVSAIIPYNQQNATIVTDALFMQINNFAEYALMVLLESEQLIQPIEYPNTKHKIWCITEIGHEALDALNQEEFIRYYQEILGECDVFNEVINFPFIYDGRGFFLLLPEDTEISEDQLSILKYITDGGKCLREEVAQMNIYKQFFTNDKYTIYPFSYNFPIPERIQWIKDTAVYRENIRIKLNKLEVNHQVDGKSKVQQFGFDSCLCTRINSDSPLFSLLNQWVEQDLITIKTKANRTQGYFANNIHSVQIIECKNVDALTSAIDKLMPRDCTQDSKLSKKRKVTNQQLSKLKPFWGSTFKPAEPNTKRTHNIKSCKTAFQNLLRQP
ncbi:MAG: hypothetical protein WC627_02740 [Legionella sp.]